MSEKSAIVAFDPGLSGGIAILRPDQSPELHLMPTIETGQGSKRTLDVQRIMQILLDANPRLVILEKQQAYPNQGGVSNYTTGENFGTLKGLLYGLEMAFVVVRPCEWTKAMGVPGKKKGAGNGALLVCRQLFPGLALPETPRSHEVYDGPVDALLLAEYGRRTAQ